MLLPFVNILAQSFSNEKFIDTGTVSLWPRGWNVTTKKKITAPITGRVGLRLVDPGNIVHAGDANGLLVINQVQPTSVVFTMGGSQ